MDVAGLKRYLTEHGYPLTVMLAEDGTRVSARAEYDERTRTLTGLVAPLEQTGLPKPNYFDASDAQEMAAKLKNCRTASTAYVQLAVPLALNAAPYVLFYMGTDNRFTYLDVLKRWMYTIKLLRKHGITVLGIASDGDPTLLKAMLSITGRAGGTCAELGDRFVWSLVQETLLYQDITHSVNRVQRKLFNRKRPLLIGRSEASVSHLDVLVSEVSKDKHGLTHDDLHPTDLMSFNATEKVMKDDVINLLEKHVPGSEGTVALLRYMGALYRAYNDVTLAPIEAIAMFWYCVRLIYTLGFTKTTVFFLSGRRCSS